MKVRTFMINKRLLPKRPKRPHSDFISYPHPASFNAFSFSGSGSNPGSVTALTCCLYWFLWKTWLSSGKVCSMLTVAEWSQVSHLSNWDFLHLFSFWLLSLCHVNYGIEASKNLQVERLTFDLESNMKLHFQWHRNMCHLSYNILSLEFCRLLCVLYLMHFLH